MASNLKWYQSLTDVEREELKQKRRSGLLKGSKKAKALADLRRKNRENIVHTLDWDELTRKEKRQRILTEQDYKCLCCGISEEWNNIPLKFELDHIDGVRTNNDRKNLRLICPNCHSQTPTYKVGNNKQPGNVTYTEEMIIQALRENTSGYSAMKSLGMNPHGGNYSRIRKIIKNHNLKLDYSV